MNPSLLKLGKQSARHDPRTLRLARYIGALPPPPASADWTAKLGALGMMLNSTLGDCTCAAMGHLLQAWTGNATGTPVILPDQDILLAYEAACSYNPADPSTDQGGVEIDVLNYWRTNGIGPAGHKIAAYAAINVKNQTEVEQAVALFGGAYIGIALPLSAQNQVGGLWDVVGGSSGEAGSWGGHAVPVVAYDAAGLTVITWSALQKMTWAFWNAYVDEAYACVSQDWLEANGNAPSGLDLAQLQADLAEVTA